MEDSSGSVEWIAAISTAAAAGIALLFGLGFKDWIFRPSVELSSDDDDPSSRLAFPFSDGRVGGYARVQVSNRGRATARGINVRVGSVERWDGAAWVRERSELDARALAWANTPTDATVDIPAGSARPLDLLAVMQNANAGTAIMRLEIAIGTIGHPTSGANFFTDPGSWRIELVVDGDNVEVMRRYVSLGFSAEWWDPASGNLWTHAVRIAGPSAHAPSTATEAPTPAQLLQEAADQDAESDSA